MFPPASSGFPCIGYGRFSSGSLRFYRGSKIRLSVNSLAESHNIVGITPGHCGYGYRPYVPSPSDQLNLLPGRSVMVTFTAGWAPLR